MKKGSINYPEMKRIILECKDKRTQALIAYQYGVGARAGELGYYYLHYYNDGPQRSTGLKRKDVTYTDEIIRIKHPNFKQKDRQAYWPASIMKENEAWLYDIILDWLFNGQNYPKTYNKDPTFLFPITRTRICSLIDEELKKYDPHYSTHWIRHSRATHIGEITGDPMAVKMLLGHARIKTSMQYVHYTEAVIKRRLGNKSFEDVLGKAVGD